MGGLTALVWQTSAIADESANAGPEFKEIYDLVQHAGGIRQDELDHAAAKGLLWALRPKVMLVTNDAGARTNASTPVVTKSNLFDGEIAYVRIGRVGAGLPDAVHSACEALRRTNHLQGVVLDVRYAGGADYDAAAGVADLFLSKDVPLLNWGNGIVRSKPKKDAITAPVAVLMNHDTKAAAEALAAAVRQSGTGLLLGSRTAGEAMVAKEYPLKNGQKLRIAAARIEAGDNSVISPDGVKPDIDVDVPPADEQMYYADAFRVLPNVEVSVNNSLSATNQNGGTNRVAAARRRFNEAELVRERREGTVFDPDAVDRNGEPEKPVVRDPALARALDLLKGLAVVRKAG
jgi:hypothetical protein